MTGVGPESTGRLIPSVDGPGQALTPEQDVFTDQPPADAFVDIVDTAPLPDLPNGLPIPDDALAQPEPEAANDHPAVQEPSGHLPAINAPTQHEPESAADTDSADTPSQPDHQATLPTAKTPEQVVDDSPATQTITERPGPTTDTTPNRQTSVAQTQPAIGRLVLDQDTAPNVLALSPDSATPRQPTLDSVTEPERAIDQVESPKEFDRRAYIQDALRKLQGAEADLEVDKIEPAPHFRSRLDKTMRDISKLQETGREDLEGMVYLDGDYSQGKFAIFPPSVAEFPGERDHFSLLSRLIGTRVEEAKLYGGPWPVTALEIGGASSYTWCLLGEAFRGEIEAGLVALVSSNLMGEPEDFPMVSAWPSRVIDASNYETLIDTTARIRAELLADTRRLHSVHFAKSIFSDLPNVTITLPNGRPMKLADNVSIVQEIHSMSAWSKIPEYDIPEALRVLAPGGEYLVGDSDLTISYMSRTPTDRRDRREGIRIAHQVLQRRGLRDHFYDMAGAYGWHVFEDSRPPRQTTRQSKAGVAYPPK